MVNIFENLCKLSCKDETLNDLSNYSLKSKTITLELILKILEHPNTLFVHNVKILYLVKNTLCEALLKNSFSSEKTVFSLSFSIFSVLVLNYREHLKSEICIFVENVFLKILESMNSSFHHVIYAIHVLNKIF